MQRGLTGFASGVMVAASIWSLLIPAMEQSAGAGIWSFLPAVIGFWSGILFLLGLDHLIPHLHRRSRQTEGPPHPAAALDHAGAGGHPAQYPGGDGGLGWSMRAFWPETARSP